MLPSNAFIDTPVFKIKREYQTINQLKTDLRKSLKNKNHNTVNKTAFS